MLYHQTSDASAVTTALIANPAVRKVSFTGSTAVGSIVASTAGKYVKPVLLELGGKASAIVLDDANLEKAAMCCALGAFMHVRYPPSPWWLDETNSTVSLVKFACPPSAL